MLWEKEDARLHLGDSGSSSKSVLKLKQSGFSIGKMKLRIQEKGNRTDRSYMTWGGPKIRGAKVPSREKEKDSAFSQPVRYRIAYLEGQTWMVDPYSQLSRASNSVDRGGRQRGRSWFPRSETCDFEDVETPANARSPIRVAAECS